MTRERGEQAVSEDERTRLEQLAKAATPGEWTATRSSQGGVLLRRGVEYPLRDRHPQGSLQIVPEEDGLFIAAANPDTILRLLADRARLVAENARLTKDTDTERGRLEYVQGCLRDANTRSEMNRNRADAAEARVQALEAALETEQRINIEHARIASQGAGE